MKRAGAFLSYYAGLALGLGVMFSVARDADPWHFLPIAGLPFWWIGAGIGVRLGVYPSDFFRTVATVAGLIEPQQPPSDVSTQR